jgi:protoporphyrinogen oxidase
MKKITIIGAGLTGLTLGALLARKGHSVTILEKEERVGGLARTYEFDGQFYDPGPHEFCTDNPVLVEMLKNILGDDFRVCRKKAAQFFMRRMIDFPVRPLHFFGQMDKVLILKIMAELVYFRFKNLVCETMDYSFKHWVTNRFGSTMYDLYFKPYTEKVWGIDPSMLDPRTASERIAFNSVFDIILQTLSYTLFNKEQYGSAHNPLKHTFYYAKHGIGHLCDKLKEECEAAGCKVELNWELESATIKDSRAHSITSTKGDVQRGFDVLVNTVPITVLNSAFDRDDLNTDLRFRSMVFCYLDVPAPKLDNFHWIYFPEKEYSFQRITDFSHFNADMTREGHTGLCAEIACFEEDELWSMDDAKIVEKTIKELLASGLLKDAAGVKGWVTREKHAYPLQINGFIEHVAKSVEFIKTIPNLVTSGRQGLFKYCNMNECMEMAIELADSIDKDKEHSFSLNSTWKGAHNVPVKEKSTAKKTTPKKTAAKKKSAKKATGA